MIEKYCEKYNVSDDGLRKLIREALRGLSIYAPEKWPESLVDLVDDEKSSEQIVLDLAQNIQILARTPDLLEKCDAYVPLRLCALLVDGVLAGERANYDLLSILYTLFYKLILSARYIMAIDFVDDEWQYLEPPDNIQPILNAWGASNGDLYDSYWAETIAMQEVQRVLDDPIRGELFYSLLIEFEEKTETYVKDSLASMVGFGLLKLGFEGIVKHAHVFDGHIDVGLDIPNDIVELLEEMSKIEKRIFKNRFGLKERRGGSRNRNGFVWTAERKSELFRTVDSLPKINGKDLWKYALEELTDKNFSWRIVDLLRNETSLRDTPKQLFERAVRTWRKYSETWDNPKSDETPFAFALYHACSILQSPETKYSTLRKYFYEGKKLAKPVVTEV